MTTELAQSAGTTSLTVPPRNVGTLKQLLEGPAVQRAIADQAASHFTAQRVTKMALIPSPFR